MPGGSTIRSLLQRRTYLNQPNSFPTSNSQYSGGPSNEEELERTNNVDDGNEEDEEDSETIPTQGYNPAVDPVTKKPPLEWKGNCFLNQKASRMIGQIWSRRFTGPWYEFKLVPHETRSVLFDEFKRHFSFDETHEPTIRRIREATAKENLKKKLNRAREAAKIANKTTSIKECKDYPPVWIPPDIWNEMIDVRWGQEEFEKRREIMRKNRLTSKEGTHTRHCAGSVSIASHWVDSSGGLTKGKIYGAPHVDINILHGGSQSSSASTNQGCTSASVSSTQPLHSQFSLEEVVQRVLDRLKQSSDIPMQSTVHASTTNHVVMSSQPTVPTSPYISD